MILNKINVDLCFSYDIFWNDKKTVENHTIETIRAIAISAGMLKSGDTIPLLHFPILLLPRSIRELVQILSPKIIGIPERELGASLFERAYNIILIRKILDTSHKNILLHILGTGNPISILIYSLCGADSFDGLEWCQTVVNPETGHLFHFAQKDLLNCDCPYCCSDLGYPIQTLAHNLKFMKGFMESIQKSIQENESKRFARNYLDNRIVTKLIDFGAFK
jgi:queuine/archaeosine tRNA-ribosyltransferase